MHTTVNMETLTVPGTLDALTQIRDYVMDAATRANLDKQPAYRLSVAIDEIATNAITYGYAQQPGKLTIRALLEYDKLLIILEDTGDPFDPRQASAPDETLTLEEREMGGLGVYFAISNVDEFSYERVDGMNRNIFGMRRTHAENEPAPAPEPVKNGRLLILEDDQTTRRLLALRFEQLNYAVTADANHPRHFTHIKNGEFDLLILGIDPSFPSSYEILEHMKSDFTLNDFPVIVFASSYDEESQMRCVELGVDDWICGAEKLALLEARVRSGLRRKQYHDQNAVYVQRLENLADDLRLVILPLGIALSAEKNLDQLLEMIMVQAKSICNADAGTMYLITPDNRLKFAIMRTDSLGIALGGTTGKEIVFPPLNLYDPITGAPNHQNVATSAALNGRSINIPDIYNALNYDFSATKEFDKRNAYRSISSLTTPLKDYEGKVIGVMQLLNAKNITNGQVIPFNAYHQLVVESLSSLAAVALNNRMLVERQKELVKFELDVQTARQIQEGFLPEKLPELPGWQIAACVRPAREVAGDFYDVFSISSNRIGFVVADVCDKGVPAAMFMALVRSLLRAFAQQYYAAFASVMEASFEKGGADMTIGTKSLKNAVALTNDYIIQTHSSLNMFATLFFGVLDPGTGMITYINAGHNPPMILSNGKVKQRLEATDPAVGMTENVRYSIRYAKVEPGETLVAYTDGVTEAQNSLGEFYGVDRMVNLLQDQARNPGALLTYLEDDVRSYRGSAPQSDDLTLLILQRSSR